MALAISGSAAPPAVGTGGHGPDASARPHAEGQCIQWPDCNHFANGLAMVVMGWVGMDIGIDSEKFFHFDRFFGGCKFSLPAFDVRQTWGESLPYSYSSSKQRSWDRADYIYNQIRLPEHIHHVGHRASSCQGNYCMQVVDQLCHEFEREVSQMTQDALKNQDLG